MKKRSNPWLRFVFGIVIVGARHAVPLLLISGFLWTQSAWGALAVPEEREKPLVTFLDNGLQVAVKRVPASSLVSCQLWVKSGSITEEKYLGCGISHYLEHMLFKGTTRRGVGAIAQEVEGLGGTFNAYTSYDRTVFSIQMPAEHFEKALDILSDAAMNSVFDPAEFEKERKVILQELSFSEDDPEKKAARLLWATAFREHPVRHPVIGYSDLFEKITRDDVIDYYRRHYVPNNMLLVVAGQVEPSVALKKVEAYFGKLPRRALPPVYLPEEPPQMGPRRLEREGDIQKTYFYLAFHGPRVTSPDVAPIDVLAEILGGGKSSRLYQRLREGKKLAYSIEAWSYTGKEAGLFAIDATLAAENSEKLRQAIWEEIQAIQKEGVSRGENEKAKASILKTILSMRQTAVNHASTLGSNLFSAEAPDYDLQYLRDILRVEPEEVTQIARKYFSPEKESLVVLRPKSPSAPKEKPAASEAVLKNDIQKLRLPSGLTLLTRADPTQPLVSIRAVLKGGVLSEDEKISGVCHLMTQMFLKGSRARPGAKFMEKLEALGGEISPYTGYNSFGVQIDLLAQNWREGLSLLAEVIQKPRFDADALEAEKKIILAGIRAKEDEPFDAAGILLRQTLYVKHPYRLQTYGTLESVPRLQVRDVEEYYRQMVRPQNMVLTIFGDVPEKEVQEEAQKLFRKFTAAAPPTVEKKEEPPQKEVRKKIKVKDSQQTVVVLGFHTVNLYDPDQYPLEIIGNIYSGQGSRLFKSVREEQGLVYTIGAYQMLGLDPGFFTFYAGARPDKAAQVLDLIWKEIRLLKEKGLTPEELERAKNGLIGERERDLEKNSDFAFKVGLDELYGLGYRDYKEYEKRIRAVTAADVTRVARKYFTEEAYALVEVKPK